MYVHRNQAGIPSDMECNSNKKSHGNPAIPGVHEQVINIDFIEL